jgi:hypothetical protein
MGTPTGPQTGPPRIGGIALDEGRLRLPQDCENDPHNKAKEDESLVVSRPAPASVSEAQAPAAQRGAPDDRAHDLGA